jgi:hypothetical protein
VRTSHSSEHQLSADNSLSLSDRVTFTFFIQQISQTNARGKGTPFVSLSSWKQRTSLKVV